ncbi:MAG: hypothetical protein VZT48_00490 [Bulleidia sp.]|nr:hypothetical protein [Bulleidia sp.]
MDEFSKRLWNIIQSEQDDDEDDDFDEYDEFEDKAEEKRPLISLQLLSKIATVILCVTVGIASVYGIARGLRVRAFRQFAYQGAAVFARHHMSVMNSYQTDDYIILDARTHSSYSDNIDDVCADVIEISSSFSKPVLLGFYAPWSDFDEGTIRVIRIHDGTFDILKDNTNSMTDDAAEKMKERAESRLKNMNVEEIAVLHDTLMVRVVTSESSENIVDMLQKEVIRQIQSLLFKDAEVQIVNENKQLVRTFHMEKDGTVTVLEDHTDHTNHPDLSAADPREKIKRNDSYNMSVL